MQLVATHTLAISDLFMVGQVTDSDHFVAHDHTPPAVRKQRGNPLGCIANSFRSYFSTSPNAARHAITQANRALEPMHSHDIACSFVFVTVDGTSAEIGLAGNCKAASYAPDGTMIWLSDQSLIPAEPESNRHLGDDYPRPIWEAEARRMAESHVFDGSSALDGTPASQRQMNSKYLSLDDGSRIVIATPDVAQLLLEPTFPAMFRSSSQDFEQWARAILFAGRGDHVSCDGGLVVLTAKEDASASHEGSDQLVSA